MSGLTRSQLFGKQNCLPSDMIKHEPNPWNIWEFWEKWSKTITFSTLRQSNTSPLKPWQYVDFSIHQLMIQRNWIVKNSSGQNLIILCIPWLWPFCLAKLLTFLDSCETRYQLNKRFFCIWRMPGRKNKYYLQLETIHGAMLNLPSFHWRWKGICTF